MCPDKFNIFYSYDPGKAAELFAQVAGLLAGFSLAAMVLMVERRSDLSKPASRGSIDSIQRSLFAALMTLMLAALLFANAAAANRPDHVTSRSLSLVALAGLVFAFGVFPLLHGVIQLLLITGTTGAPKGATGAQKGTPRKHKRSATEAQKLARITAGAVPLVGIMYVDSLFSDLIERLHCDRIGLFSVDMLLLGVPSIVLVGALCLQQLRWGRQRTNLSGVAFTIGASLVVLAAVLSGVVSKLSPQVHYWTWSPTLLTTCTCWLLFIFAIEMERTSVGDELVCGSHDVHQSCCSR